MTSRSLTAAALGAALLLLTTAGCGSSKSSAPTTTTQQQWATQFANSVCTPVATWKQNLTNAVNTVKANPNRQTLKASLNSLSGATNSLVQTLKGLDVPQSPSAKQAQSTISTLADELHQDVSAITSEIKSASSLQGAAQAATAAKGTLATMRTQIQQAGAELRGLPKGDLKQAFVTSPACQTLAASNGTTTQS